MNLKSTRLIKIILIAGLVLRLVLFFVFHNDPQFVMDDDSSGYLTLAENIRLGNGFSMITEPPYAPNTFRTPGYPFFLMLHRVITGSYQTALITQSILIVLSAWIIARIGFLLDHRRIGIGAALIFLFMPFSIRVSLEYLTQPLFTFLLMLSIWWWLLFITTKRPRFLYGAIILFPLAAIVRPIAIWLPIPFLIGLLLVSWHTGAFSIRAWFKTVLITAAVFVAILAPWCYRNYKQIGNYTLSTMRAFQLYYYDVPAILAYARHISYGEARTILESDVRPYIVSKPDDYTSARALNERSRYYIKKYPFAAIASRPRLVMNFFLRDGIRYWFEYWQGDAVDKRGIVFLIAVVIERLILAAFALGTLLSLWRFFRKKDSPLFGIIIIIIGYFAVLSGGVSSAGLRFPVEGFILLTGGAGLYSIIRYTYEKLQSIIS